MASNVDSEKRLLADRMVVLADAIDDELANLVIAKLLFLEEADPQRAVTLNIDSPGGSVTASLSLCDVMQAVEPPVSTGKRFALEAARLQFVPLSRRGDGSPEAFNRLKGALVHAFAQRTGQSPSRIRRACREGESFSAHEAMRFGLIDSVLKPR